MSDLYKRIDDLCKEHNISITAMCKESGASRASLSDLKSGRNHRLSADTLSKIAHYFNVSVDFLLGIDDETIVIERAKAEMRKRSFEGIPLGNDKILLSHARLGFLFEQTGFDIDIFCYNQSIDPYAIRDWVEYGDLPSVRDVDKVLKVFRLNPNELFSDYELNIYKTYKDRLEYERSLKSNKNVIKIINRNGSCTERTLSDDQLSLIMAMLNQMPEPSENK